MNLSESMKQLKNLAAALPAILELAGPLESIGSLEQLESRIADRQRELDRLDSEMAASKTVTEAAKFAESALKNQIAELAKSVGDKAFADAKPRRDAARAEVAAAESELREKRGEVRKADEAVKKANAELDAIEKKIAAAKSDALKALGI